MIRNDFVSNSSSCSFVISDHYHTIGNALKNGEYTFLKLINQIPHNCRNSYDNGRIIFDSGNECFKNDILHYNIDNKDGIKIIAESPNEIVIKDLKIFKHPYKLSASDMDFMIRLIEDSEEIEFDFGLDDCGTKAPLASTILTLLYNTYKIKYIDNDEGCDFNSNVISVIDFLKGKENV